MRTISASEAVQAFGVALEVAQREPVMIREQNRDVAVLVSAAEYEKLRKFRIAEFEALCDRIAAKAAARGMTEDRFVALMQDVR